MMKTDCCETVLTINDTTDLMLRVMVSYEGPRTEKTKQDSLNYGWRVIKFFKWCIENRERLLDEQDRDK